MKRTAKSFYRAQQVFMGCEELFGGAREACRVVWAGPLDAQGKQPPVRMLFGRREDRLRGAYRLAYGGRLKKTDTIVVTCGNPRCVTRPHLRLMPAAKRAVAPTG